MKKFILLIALLVVSLGSFGQNLLMNGDFENEFEGWTNLQGDNGSYGKYFVERKNTERGFALKATVIKLGSNPWDIQSLRRWDSKRKKKYLLTFYARTRTPNASIRIFMQNKSYQNKEFQLSTKWSKYTWEFKADEDDLEMAIHFFELGTFYMDEITIEKIKK